MDTKFLEFLGNFLLSAAKGQEQTESLNRMVREGFKTFEQQLNLFQKFYGLERKPDSSDQYLQMWSKAASDFAKSYQDVMGLMGMVPREDHEALCRENEKLKEKVAALEETPGQGKRKTGAREMDFTESFKGFEGLMKKQAEQFQALMASYGKLSEVDKPGKESTATQPSKKSRARRVR